MDFARDKNRTIIERAPLGMPKAIVAAAAVGIAFGLGVVSARAAGRDDDVVAPVEPELSRADAITRADARTKAYEARVKAATSTWHAEITSPEAPSAAVLPTKFKQPIVEAVVEGAAVPATVEAAVEAPSSAPTVDADVVNAKPEPEPQPKVAAEPVPQKHEERDADEGDVTTAPKPEQLTAALSKVLGEKAAPAPSTDNRRYAVQLASTPSKDKAQGIAAGYAEKGFNAKVIAAEVPGKGTMYRVRVNGFATRAAADGIKARIGQGLVVTDD
ncbi:MAG TPA: SPOR domain-containing protein [Myxococcota bacterium]